MDIRVGGYNYFFSLLTLLSVPLVSIKMLLVVKLFYFLKCQKWYIEKMSASASSGYPDTKKQMKAQRPCAFIVSKCLDTPMKHKARVFDKLHLKFHFFK